MSEDKGRSYTVSVEKYDLNFSYGASDDRASSLNTYSMRIIGKHLLGSGETRHATIDIDQCEDEYDSHEFSGEIKLDPECIHFYFSLPRRTILDLASILDTRRHNSFHMSGSELTEQIRDMHCGEINRIIFTSEDLGSNDEGVGASSSSYSAER